METKKLIKYKKELIEMDEGECYLHLQRMVANIAYDYHSILEIEEAIGIADEAFLEAFRKYDVTKGAEITTFAYTVIKRRILDAVKTAKSRKERFGPIISFSEISNSPEGSDTYEQYSLDTLKPERYLGGHAIKDEVESFIDTESMRTEIERIMSPLSEEDKEIVRCYYLKDMKQVEIAQKLGNCTQARVSERLNNALKIMRREYFRQEFQNLDLTAM